MDFDVFTLTDAVNKVKYVPGRLSSLGLFRETGVTTPSVNLDYKDGVLTVVRPTPRGGPGVTVARGARSLVNLAVPHFEINDSVMAEETQGVRAFGSENTAETVASVVTEKLGTHAQSMAATQEYSRVGTVKGIITYEDGTQLNLFEQLRISPLPLAALDLAADTKGALRAALETAIIAMTDSLDGVSMTGIGAICGKGFYSKLTAHQDAADTYKNWQAAEVLRQGFVQPTGGEIYGAFRFNEIVWEAYRGRIGGTPFVADEEAYLSPLGVPGLFRTYYAPADYTETVNTLGRRLYSKQYDMPNGKGVHLDTQMNALEICTRPGALLKATSAAPDGC